MINSHSSGHKHEMLKQQLKQNSHTYTDLYTVNCITNCCQITLQRREQLLLKQEICSIWTILNSLNLSLVGKRVLFPLLYFFLKASVISHCQKDDLDRSACQSCSNHRHLLNRLYGEWRVFIRFTQHPSTKHWFCSYTTYILAYQSSIFP